MKAYFLIIEIFDGDNVYWDKSVIHTDNPDDHKAIISQWYGSPLEWDDWHNLYCPDNERGFRVYKISEITEEEKQVLQKWL